MILNVQGKKVEITNWDEFSEKLLNAIGLQTISAIVKKVGELRLVNEGYFKGGFNDNNLMVKGNTMTITNDMPYAVYLEYGTPGTKRGVNDPFGESSRGPNPSRKMPLTKTGHGFELVPSLKRWKKLKGVKMSDWQLAKTIQENGMEPHAPIRKVLYNQNKMAQIINKAVKVASR